MQHRTLGRVSAGGAEGRQDCCRGGAAAGVLSDIKAQGMSVGSRAAGLGGHAGLFRAEGCWGQSGCWGDGRVGGFNRAGGVQCGIKAWGMLGSSRVDARDAEIIGAGGMLGEECQAHQCGRVQGGNRNTGS